VTNGGKYTVEINDSCGSIVSKPIRILKSNANNISSNINLLNDSNNVAVCLMNIGIIYYENSDFQVALEYYFKSYLILQINIWLSIGDVSKNNK